MRRRVSFPDSSRDSGSAFFPLFQATRVLSANEDSRLGSSAPTTLTFGGESRQSLVTISNIVVRSNAGRTMIAMVCSNDYIVLRLTTAGLPPVIRKIQWSFSDRKKVGSLAISPELKWLLVITLDCTLFLVPLHAIFKRQLGSTTVITGKQKGIGSLGSLGSADFASLSGSDDERFGVLPSLLDFTMRGASVLTKQEKGSANFLENSEIVEIKVLSEGSSAFKMAQGEKPSALWWRSWDGNDYAVVATRKHVIAFISLRTGEERLRINISFPFSTMQLVMDESASLKYLLFRAPDVCYYKLLLEHEPHFKLYENIISVPGKSVFAPQRLVSFNCKKCNVTVEDGKHGSVVVVYSQLGRCEVYDTSLSPNPLFVYLIPGPVRHLHYTPRFCFVVPETASGSGRCKLQIVSNFVTAGAASSSNHRPSDNAVLQELEFPEPIVGMGSDVPEPLREHSSRNSSRIPSVVDFRPFFVWSQHSLYFVSVKTAPETIFRALVKSASITPAALEEEQREDDGGDYVTATPKQIVSARKAPHTEDPSRGSMDGDRHAVLRGAAMHTIAAGSPIHSAVAETASEVSFDCMAAAETLGKTAGIDVLGMYETLGLESMRSMDGAKAAKLFDLASLALDRYASHLLKERSDEVVFLLISHLEETIHSPASLDRSTAFQATELIIVYYACQARKGSDEALDRLRSIILSSEHFSSTFAFRFLALCGFVELLVDVACTKVSEAENILLQLFAAGYTRLESHLVDRLISACDVRLLRNVGSGSFFRQMTPDQQVILISESLSALKGHYTKALLLLPRISVTTMVRVIEVLHPTRNDYKMAGAKRDARSSPSFKKEKVEVEAYAMGGCSASYQLLELYIIYLAEYCRRVAEEITECEQFSLLSDLKAARHGAISSLEVSGLDSFTAHPKRSTEDADFSSTTRASVSHSRRDLHRALIAYHGTYRSSPILVQLLEREDLVSSRLLLALCGDWNMCIQCDFALFWKLLSSGAVAERLAEHVGRDCVDIVVSCVGEEPPTRRVTQIQSECIVQLLCFWLNKGLDAKVLQNCLENHFAELVMPLGYVVALDEVETKKVFTWGEASVNNALSSGTFSEQFPPMKMLHDNFSSDVQSCIRGIGAKYFPSVGFARVSCSRAIDHNDAASPVFCNPALRIGFSASFLLRVIKEFLGNCATDRTELDREREVESTFEALLAKTEGVLSREAAGLSGIPFRPDRPKATRRTDEDLFYEMEFSCGHCSSYEKVVSTVIPAFLERVNLIPVRVGQLGNMMASVYIDIEKSEAVSMTGVLCPVCLYNQVVAFIKASLSHDKKSAGDSDDVVSGSDAKDLEWPAPWNPDL